MKCPYDGQVIQYIFGEPEESTRQWRIEARTLARAIRAFRVGALYPHQYVDRKHRIATKGMDDDGWATDRFLASKPGAKVLRLGET